MDEDNQVSTEIFDATPDEFPESPHSGERKPPPEHLPPSDDAEFWQDGQKHSVSKAEIEAQRQDMIKKMSTHNKLRIVGREIICSSCPHEHTLPLSVDEWTLDMNGKLVMLDNSV